MESRSHLDSPFRWVPQRSGHRCDCLRGCFLHVTRCHRSSCWHNCAGHWDSPGCLNRGVPKTVKATQLGEDLRQNVTYPGKADISIVRRNLDVIGSYKIPVELDNVHVVIRRAVALVPKLGILHIDSRECVLVRRTNFAFRASRIKIELQATSDFGCQIVAHYRPLWSSGSEGGSLLEQFFDSMQKVIFEDEESGDTR